MFLFQQALARLRVEKVDKVNNIAETITGQKTLSLSPLIAVGGESSNAQAVQTRSQIVAVAQAEGAAAAAAVIKNIPTWTETLQAPSARAVEERVTPGVTVETYTSGPLVLNFSTGFPVKDVQGASVAPANISIVGVAEGGSYAFKFISDVSTSSESLGCVWPNGTNPIFVESKTYMINFIVISGVKHAVSTAY
jgi:hypothetical protein